MPSGRVIRTKRVLARVREILSTRRKSATSHFVWTARRGERSLRGGGGAGSWHEQWPQSQQNRAAAGAVAAATAPRTRGTRVGWKSTAPSGGQFHDRHSWQRKKQAPQSGLGTHMSARQADNATLAIRLDSGGGEFTDDE
jgi:hypothetical protein